MIMFHDQRVVVFMCSALPNMPSDPVAMCSPQLLVANERGSVVALLRVSIMPGSLIRDVPASPMDAGTGQESFVDFSGYVPHDPSEAIAEFTEYADTLIDPTFDDAGGGSLPDLRDPASGPGLDLQRPSTPPGPALLATSTPRAAAPRSRVQCYASACAKDRCYSALCRLGGARDPRGGESLDGAQGSDSPVALRAATSGAETPGRASPPPDHACAYALQ